MSKPTAFTVMGTLTFLAGIALAEYLATVPANDSARAAEIEPPPPAPQPVEDDVHDLMEYAFEFPYERLASGLLEEPERHTQWKSIKADALILAELSNLLIARPLPAKPQAWKQAAADVRTAGGQLYRAAETKDYPTARRHYEKMIQSCNTCHDTFQTGVEIEL